MAKPNAKDKTDPTLERVEDEASSSSKKTKKKQNNRGVVGESVAGSTVVTEATANETASLTTAEEKSSTTDSVVNNASVAGPSAEQQLVNKNTIQDLMRVLSMGDRKKPKTMEDYKFWKTQPVPKTDEIILENGPIEPDKAPEEVRQEPYPLPKDFEWCLLDIDDAKEVQDLYELLAMNYVEDDDALFRFDYSASFLKWGLKPPGWKKSWHIGVRVASNKKLVGFISGIPATLRIHDCVQKLVEINFLCVHKKLRTKRLAPVLIKEVTRRVHLEGIFQAVYTAGVYLPKPISSCRYYHRSLNPKKLIETSFSHLGRNMTLARTIRLYKLPETTSTPGMREMKEADVPAVTRLLNKNLNQFKVAPVLDEEEVRHWLLPLDNVVNSFVVEDPITNQITQFVSFYTLPSTVINHPVHTHIKAAYLFYYAAKDNDRALQTLIKDALILARNLQFDVFNCLELMHNSKFIEELKFGKGDGNLHYYLYNYRCKPVECEEMGLVLL
ncbi:Glycylpeptide N-tetradecanoyltransferase 2 [Quaeritorhiza haematococci]|nr:Glycylpeptide N-tetradecanoyltransferase 2 [Quaeritorhiza haematococci]